MVTWYVPTVLLALEKKLWSSSPKKNSEVPCVGQLRDGYQQQRIGVFSRKSIEGFYSLEDHLFAAPKWFIDEGHPSR